MEGDEAAAGVVNVIVVLGQSVVHHHLVLHAVVILTHRPGELVLSLSSDG